MKATLLIVAAIVSAPALHAAKISAAERASLALVSRYLATNDAQAFLESLAPDAPLRDLPVSDAKDELLARLGPAAGSTWTLRTVAGSTDVLANVAYHVEYPSGFEDGLLLRMQAIDGAWRLYDLTSLAEPIPEMRHSNPSAAGKTRISFREALAKRTSRPRGWGWLGLIAVACFVASLLARRFSDAGSKVFIAGAVIVAVLAGMLKLAPDVANRLMPRPLKVATATGTSAGGMTELRALLQLRNSLARELKGTPPTAMSDEAREVAALWLMRAGFVVTEPSLDQLKFADRTAMADLVRAAHALVQSHHPQAVAAYDKAMTRAPLRDDVLLEAVLFSDDAPRYVQRMRTLGTRDASAFYTLAAAKITAEPRQARELLETAWSMQPISRETLVRDPRLFAALHDEHLARVTALFASAEPAVRPLDFAREAADWPAEAHAFVSGEYLKIEIGNASIDVPGGAPLAPASAQVVSSTHWREAKIQQALADTKTLIGMKDPPNTPIVRGRFESTADALANHNRWNDLLALTSAVTPSSASVSRELLVHRAVALTHANQAGAARALLAGPAVGQWIADRDDPFTLLALGDLASRLGESDLARRMYEGAATGDDLKKIVSKRLDALERRRKLTESALSLSTQNFDIRYDPRMNAAVASRVGDVLEAELLRLHSKFPPQPFRRTTVNVLYWEDFSGGITGSDHILGLYDGEIIVPFAEVERFQTEVVSILTHELTHAIVAQQTGDNAPRWFQEGIAQRMELVPIQPNVFKNRPVNEVIPVSLLDAIMENTFNPMAISDGYVTAQTFIRFLEDRYGPNALATMLHEFAAGNNGDDALRTLTGNPISTIDTEFREWGRIHTTDFADRTPWPYLHLYSPGVDPRVRAGFTFTNRKP